MNSLTSLPSERQCDLTIIKWLPEIVRKVGSSAVKSVHVAVAKANFPDGVQLKGEYSSHTFASPETASNLPGMPAYV